MKNKKTFYITTTIPYANAPPHIGFALEIIQADVIARWKTLNNYEVFFLTGTDEHGTKNYKTAKEQGLTPQAFVDKNANFFKELTKSLNISNNNFIRTTDKKAHWPGVIELWNLLTKKGDIYKKQYTGNYCSGCERFITEKELEKGKCPNHPNIDIQQISEENYFFKLSKYSEKITELIKKDKLKIRPIKWKNDFLALIKDGLTDVSFSRDKKILPWGVPVPEDKNQVMYVWADALGNYLTGIGYPDKKYKKFWPADVHVVGKDMLRFHTGIWPGMLLSAGLELPKEVIVHGFLTVGGQKMSKSLGNVTSPLKLRETYSSDSIRYALMRATPFGDDGDFSEQALVERHNNELADKLGNLISRVSTLAEKYSLTKTPNKLIKSLNLEQIEKHFKNYELDKALNEIFAFIDKCNEYTQNKKPWEVFSPQSQEPIVLDDHQDSKYKGILRREASQQSEKARSKSESNSRKVLYELADSIKAIAILLFPFMPETSEKIAKVFNFNISLKEINNPLKITKIKKAQILFNKISSSPKEVCLPQRKRLQLVRVEGSENSVLVSSQASTEKLHSKSKSDSKQEFKNKEQIEGIATMNSISFNEWNKVDMRVAKIKKAEDIEGADNLYKLEIEADRIRVLVAGLKKYYTKEELKNKRCIILANLEPRTMKGIISEGMILAAVTDNHEKVVLIQPEKDVKVGTKIQ